MSKSSPKDLIAPLRFGVVQPNLYRGSYPRDHNVRFLERLNLKTIVSVTPEPLKEQDAIVQFARDHGIKLVHVECAAAESKSKKKRGVPVPYRVAQKTVEYMIDADMAPMYIHCLNGSQVTCLLVACLRKLCFWSTAAIAEEFLRHSDMEAKDQLFVENFRAEITVPRHPVPWMWKGLSKLGVVKNHPTLIFHENPPNAGPSNSDCPSFTAVSTPTAGNASTA
ncbi:putative tyrosine-protein phosphatase Oca6p [Trichomonascus vanleenenianus]|uniref:protein-tyrosine-phosphatase n=1 Tax=Trichomonascus vanleenenianus TaxID=2268995 RepID=UPI003EC9D66B